MEREYDVDLLKFIACLMVVVLHGIEPGEAYSMQQAVYLLGSFAIPLFFLVNGYLLADKRIDLPFANARCLRYFKFIVVWAVLISLPVSLVNHKVEVLQIVAKSLLGKGYLFHLWFLIALVVLYYIKALLSKQQLFKQVSFSKFIGLACLMLTIVFFMILTIKENWGLEFREIVPAYLRIVTNGAYFFFF